MPELILENEKYSVSVSSDYTYTLSSSDNRKYDYIINTKSLGRNDTYQTLRVSVQGEKTAELALIVDYFAAENNFAVLENCILTILQNDFITQIDLEKESVKTLPLNIYGTTFSIYQAAEGYLIYGEYEILKLDKSLNTVWRFCGRDAFVSVSGKNPFEITSNSIRLYDFEDNFYELDFNGNPIKEILSD